MTYRVGKFLLENHLPSIKNIYIASHETTYERDEVARAPSLETSKLSLYIFRQLHPYQRELVII
jgi:hypothetical protein